MAAGARQARRDYGEIRGDVLRIDDARVRRSQRPRFVEHHGVDLREAFERVGGVEQYAGPEQFAAGDDLNRRPASASAQGQVTISTEMAVTSASCTEAPRHSQNSAVASAAKCTTGA